MYIAQTHSTNTLLKEEIAKQAEWLEKEEIPVLWAGYQTAGRGQAGNGWESEEGKNLLCSILLREPKIAIEAQWRLSMLAAVVLRETVAQYLQESKIEGIEEKLCIKWPNDLYWEGKKLAGILIENSLSEGKIAYAIVGIGLNINQERWVGNAPNPYGMKSIGGKDYVVEKILNTLIEKLQYWLEKPSEDWREKYEQHLYRKEGYHRYVEREVSLAPTMNASSKEGSFLAKIEAIRDNGEIVLKKEDGSTKAYHFKQIRYVIEK